jgi:hypothetical protein
MLLIRKQGFARAGLLGNPSDGYHGKTISIIVRNFRAQVVLYEWDSVEIVLAEDDRARFSSIYDLARDVRLHGYYGGIRLIKATIRRFVEYCEARRLPLHDRTFSVRYETNIPRQVGLAGSSAIIVATLRCLMEFYGIEIPIVAQPTFVLDVEQQELGISAGLQDRVIQVHEGVVYMDFDRAREHMVDGLPCYTYEPLDPACLPPLYVAYHDALSWRRAVARRFWPATARGWPRSSTRTSTPAVASTPCPPGRSRWWRRHASAARARSSRVRGAPSSAPMRASRCSRRSPRDWRRSDRARCDRSWSGRIARPSSIGLTNCTAVVGAGSRSDWPFSVVLFEVCGLQRARQPLTARIDVADYWRTSPGRSAPSSLTNCSATSGRLK